MRHLVLLGLACTAITARAQFTQSSLTTAPATSPTNPLVLNVGQAYTSALTITISFNQLGTSINRIEIRNLPPGLTAGGTNEGELHVVTNRPNAVLFGTPTRAGDYTLSVTAVTSTGLNSIAQVPAWQIYLRVAGGGTGPAFTTQPQNQTVPAGGTATFTAAASGDPAPTYQWRKDDVDLPGATGASLIVTNVSAASVGAYTVVATNASGSVTSNRATLALAAATAPTITAQPLSVSVPAGGTVSLAVAAAGATTYQWSKDDRAIAGATDAQLLLRNVGAADAGTYAAAVGNAGGTVTSQPATLTLAPGATSQLANLSVRTNLAASQTLIVGFSTTGAKDILVRGVGPSLAALGLTGFHPDPLIEVYNGSTLVTQNDNWAAALTTAFAGVGAFPLTASARDAALQSSFSGAHTAQVKGPGAGIVLVEVYDAGTGATRLANVSARNQVGTGDNILIAGFVIGGNAAKTLLLRGVGPRLAAFGVSGALVDPKLEVFNAANTRVAENDNWSASIASTFAPVGAFDLTAGSRDSALLITLPPGLYTAQLSGIGGTTGEALVEVYEVN